MNIKKYNRFLCLAVSLKDEVVLGYYNQYEDKHELICHSKNYVGDDYVEYEERVEVKPETICQFTGRVDVKGQWIYERSIITFTDDTNKIFVGEVIWEDFRFVIELITAPHTKVPMNPRKLYEVIGHNVCQLKY